MFALANNTANLLYTVPSDTRAIVKTIQASHEAASNVDVDLYLKKSGGSDTEISHAQLNKDFKNMLSNTLNLEAGDVIKMQASTADTITGFVSYALVNREDQNG